MNSTTISCLWVLAGTLFLALVIILCISIVNTIKSNRRMKDSDKKGIYAKSASKCNVWFIMSDFWLAIEYLLVIIPFELSASILYIEAFATNNDFEKSSTIVLLSIVSIALIIVSFAIKPQNHVAGYRNAYVTIDHAINTYLLDSNEERLSLSLHECECEISTVFYDSPYPKFRCKSGECSENQHFT